MLTFDLRSFERAAIRMDALANQVPFALSQALNDGAEAVRRNDLPATWAEHITARNANFMKAALSTKGTRATKKMLRVVVYDRFGRANLVLHDVGGTRKPRGNAIAVPNRTNLQPRRGAHGVPKGLRPRNLPNSFVKPSKYGPVLFQRTGSYVKGSKGAPGQDNRHLKAMYGFAPSAPVRADVPFRADFARGMQREVARAFGPRLQRAMATAQKAK